MGEMRGGEVGGRPSKELCVLSARERERERQTERQRDRESYFKAEKAS